MIRLAGLPATSPLCAAGLARRARGPSAGHRGGGGWRVCTGLPSARRSGFWLAPPLLLTHVASRPLGRAAADFASPTLAAAAEPGGALAKPTPPACAKPVTAASIAALRSEAHNNHATSKNTAHAFVQFKFMFKLQLVGWRPLDPISHRAQRLSYASHL